MEQNQEEKVTGLPENAYRELNEGEEYTPLMKSTKQYPEVTVWSVGMGLLMAIIFSAAAAYAGLKIGQVFEAAIPISIIAVGASAATRRKNALGQNVIIQSIGASSGVIVAGTIFTIPALYILKSTYPEIQVDFLQIFLSSLLGGILGILFLIPFRKYFVKEQHGKFPFPEAKATTEILVTGEKGGAQAGILIVSGLIGGLFDFMFSSFRIFHDEISTRLIPWGEKLATDAKMVFKLNISALVFSFGYLIGLRYALIIAVGSMVSWLVMIPLVNEVGSMIASATGGTNIFASMSAEAIFKVYVRPIGVGAIAMAGIIGIIKSSGVIKRSFGLAFSGLSSKNTVVEKPERTQQDLKMPFVMIFILLTIIAIFIFLVAGVHITLVQALVALATLIIISFLFTTVAANAIAIVGSNPVSGMTLMTLILSSVVLVGVGLQGSTGMVAALIIGGIVCTALSMAGGFVTDLKIGYWLGSTPYKQQTWKFLGTLVSAATVGLVIYILNDAYGFVKVPGVHDDPLIAPQANAMASIIEPLMQPGAKVPWILFAIGGIISLLMNFIKIPPLAFALGMFIPLQLNTPLIVGGLLHNYISKSSKDKKLAEAREQRGTLIASGFIAGAALLGVVGAMLLFFNVDLNLHLFQVYSTEAKAWVWEEGNIWPGLLAFIAFAGIITYFVWDSMRAKVEEDKPTIEQTEDQMNNEIEK
jgi:putative OPT family oligopeptide transporter